jgi:hypothetical protein
MRKISLQSRVKVAVLLTFGALFVPIAAQAGTAGTVTSWGTVSLGLPTCTELDTSYDTSVSAKSVVLMSDTASANANTDGSTYLYFTETDTTKWGADYTYGSTMDPATCLPVGMSGTVTITRGRFMSSPNVAFSETTTNTTDFIQFVGNTKLVGVNGGAYKGSACGNMTGPRNVASVTASCSSGILADYSQLTQSGSVAWRDGSQVSGSTASATGQAFVVVKVRKAAIAGAPTGSGWVSIETYTVTSV